MDGYDFSGLTLAQKNLLTFQGWQLGMRSMQPSRRTVKKLMDRGLLIEHESRGPCGPFTLIIRTYEVPIPVHMAWCAHCSELEGKKGKHK